MLFGGFRMMAEKASGFGAAHGLKKLCSCGRGLGYDVQLSIAPVRGHLAAAGTGVIGSAYRLQQLFIRSGAQCEAKSAIAIISIKPVVTWFECESGSSGKGFVSCARDL